MSVSTPVAELRRAYPELKPLGGRPGIRAYLRQMWARREFALAVSAGDLRAQNAESSLGSLWHVLNPLMLAAVFYVIFGIFFGARDDVPNYPAFLITGLFIFHYTNRSMLAGALSVIANGKLIQSISFPRALLPLATAGKQALAQLWVLGVLIGLLLLTGEVPDWSWLLLPVAYVIQTVFNVGIVLTISRLVFHFRDLQNVLPYTVRLTMYMSGIIYTLDRIPERFQPLFTVNPIYVFVTLNRQLTLEGRVAEGWLWQRSILWALALLIFGFLFFRGHEEGYGRGH